MKRHRTDGVSLTFALIFLGIAAWWLVARSVDLPLPRVGWLVAAVLLLLGGLGLIGALRPGRSTGSIDAETETDAETDAETQTDGPGGGVPGRRGDQRPG